MGKTSTAVKARWNKQNYDQFIVYIPRGRKADLEDYCKDRGQTVNGLVNELIRQRLGIAAEDWKTKTTSGE